MDFDGFDSISFPIEKYVFLSKETLPIEFRPNWKELVRFLRKMVPRHSGGFLLEFTSLNAGVIRPEDPADKLLQLSNFN